MNTEIKGLVENVKFHNSENAYTVFELSTEGQEDIICVGYIPVINEGENIKVIGEYTTHPTYGKQFSVSSYEKYIPTTASGIERYLASGAIKGIGAKLAAKIVAEFGDATLNIIEEYPEKLTKIKGITEEKANTISAIFHEQIDMRRAIIFMQEYGISPAYGVKVYNKYRETSIDVIKQNPYALADDISGIGFKTADFVAHKLGIATDSPYRIRAAIKYVLGESISDGHVYLPRPLLTERAGGLLGVPSALVDSNIDAMQIENILRQEKTGDETAVYLHFYYHAEAYVARKLLTLSSNSFDKKTGWEKDIAEFEKKNSFSLAESQKEAVKECVENGLLVLTGGPGTGKTTTVNAIIDILKKEGLDITLAAPTGRAAKRLFETTGYEAKTIHRLLGVNFSDDDKRRQSFDKDENEPLEADVIILDECSMVDISLMYSLLKATPDTAKLILVGDVDQLPSVGPGKVLKDIILSGKIKVVRLEEIFRQAAESAIVMNAHRINKGEYPVLNEKEGDFFFVRRSRPEQVMETIIELATKRLPDFIQSKDIFDIQILAPMKKSILGVVNLNEKLQQALNPKASNKREKEYRGITYREGDKVMQIKNNYNMPWVLYDEKGRKAGEGLGVFNGDFGMVKSISSADETVSVRFDESKLVTYDFTQLDELELAYAVTIHKSQGSEYKVVIIPILDGPPMLMSRNLIYTAVTRAKELAVIVGIPQSLNKMVDNNREINRYTGLDRKIKFFAEQTIYK